MPQSNVTGLSRLAAAGLFLAATAAAAVAQVSTAPGAQMSPAPQRVWPSQQRPPEPIEVRICSCLYNGENVPIGDTICMSFQGRKVRATCESIVNNPSWNISSVECPSS